MRPVVSDIPTKILSEWKDEIIPKMELTSEDRILAEQLRTEGKSRLVVEELRDGVRVRARSWVGTVRFNNFEVQVIPKLAGDYLGLAELIEFATGLDALHRYRSERMLKSEGHNLIDLLAWLLTIACERLIRCGLLADYRELEDNLPVLRGRFLFQKQILKRFGQLNLLECRYDDQLMDIPENQILNAALLSCGSKVDHSCILQRVRRLQKIFSAVCFLERVNLNRIRKELIYNRMNEHYREAHVLAWLILDSMGIKDLFIKGNIRCFAFLLDMNMLFEQFLRRWMEKLLQGTVYKVEAQRRKQFIIWNADLNRPYTGIIPDIFIRNKNQPGIFLPIDAKYKLYDEQHLDISDIYQTFLYAYAFGPPGYGNIPAAFLIYPSSSDSKTPIRLHVRNIKGQTGAEIIATGISIPKALIEAKMAKPGILGMQMIEIIRSRLPEQAILNC